MFYSKYVLSKKGVLAKVWLAAHWKRRLTRQQICQTDVVKAVLSIVGEEVEDGHPLPMALRFQGHLLLGVVRIYSHQVRYLLAQCQDALKEIKMTFRPGKVNLTKDKATASEAAITLSEPKATRQHPSLDDFSISSLNLDAIRLEQEEPRLELAPFNDDLNFGPESLSLSYEGARAAEVDDGTNFLLADDALAGLESLEDDTRVDKALLDVLGGDGDDALLLPAAMPLDVALEDDPLLLPDLEGSMLDLDVSELQEQDVSMLDLDQVDAEPVPAVADMEGDDNPLQLHAVAAEPARARPVPSAVRRRVRMQDSPADTYLSSTAMKKNLADGQGTLRDFEAAPKAKKRHRRVFRNDVMDVNTKPGKKAYFLTTPLSGLSPLISNMYNEALRNVDDHHDDQDDAMMDSGDSEEALDAFDLDVPLPYEDGTASPVSEARLSVERMRGVEGGESAVDMFSALAGSDASSLVSDFYNDGDGSEDAGGDVKLPTTRSKAMLRYLSGQWHGSNTCMFNNIVEGKRRATVAGAFYELLVFKARDIVDLRQDVPFADIKVTKGPNYKRGLHAARIEE